MEHYSLTESSRNVSDQIKIQRNLDEKGSAILVMERGNPANIMTPEGYVNKKTVLRNQINRNRVICTTFGETMEKQEFDIDDIELYRN